MSRDVTRSLVRPEPEEAESESGFTIDRSSAHAYINKTVPTQRTPAPLILSKQDSELSIRFNSKLTGEANSI